MAIITLTSDWGTSDHYLAAVKGVIYTRYPEANIVDISHQINPFDLNQAWFVLHNAWHHFPKGTVHIVALNTEASINCPHVAIKYKDHYFIGTDNGLFSLLFSNEPPDEIYEIDIPGDSDYYTFPTRDLFAKTAIHIAKGGPLFELGDQLDKLFEKVPFKPATTESTIIGKAIYIDRYENIFTNISSSLFKSVGKNRKFIIEFSASRYKLDSICSSYSDAPDAEILGLFSTTGLLEIAINHGNAASLLGLQVDDTIRIQFFE